MWESAYLSPFAQAKPSRPSDAGQGRSSGGALHLDPRRSPCSPVGGTTVTGQPGRACAVALGQPRNPRSAAGICARICARDAAERAEAGETGKVDVDLRLPSGEVNRTAGDQAR